MPEGTIRAILALGFSFGTLAAYLYGMDVDSLLPITTFILGYYFKHREVSGESTRVR